MLNYRVTCVWGQLGLFMSKLLENSNSRNPDRLVWHLGGLLSTAVTDREYVQILIKLVKVIQYVIKQR